MYLVHHRKDGVYANISLSVYPEGPSMVALRLDPSQLIMKCQPHQPCEGLIDTTAIGTDPQQLGATA